MTRDMAVTDDAICLWSVKMCAPMYSLVCWDSSAALPFSRHENGGGKLMRERMACCE